MRLFAAIDLDDEARARIAALQKRLARSADAEHALRWVESGRMHLTLVFLGEVAASTVTDLLSALSNPIEIPRFSAALEVVGVFPPHGGPRVLWVGVSEGADQIAAVQGEVARRCRTAGVDVEMRPFHPHLTLARWRGRSRPSDARRVVSADARGAVARILVDHVTLYESRLLPEGPAYTPLARANLT